MSDFRQYIVILFGESKNIFENVIEDLETPTIMDTSNEAWQICIVSYFSSSTPGTK